MKIQFIASSLSSLSIIQGMVSDRPHLATISIIWPRCHGLNGYQIHQFNMKIISSRSPDFNRGVNKLHCTLTPKYFQHPSLHTWIGSRAEVGQCEIARGRSLWPWHITSMIIPGSLSSEVHDVRQMEHILNYLGALHILRFTYITDSHKPAAMLDKVYIVFCQ